MATKVIVSETCQVSVETEGMLLRLVSLGRKATGESWTTDLSAFLLDASDKIRQEQDFVFYNGITQEVEGEARPCSADGSVVGFASEDGMDVMTIQLDRVDKEVQRIALLASLYHDGDLPIPSFRSVDGLCVELCDAQSKAVFYRLYLSGDYADANTLQCGSLVRKGDDWLWVAQQRIFPQGLEEATQLYAAAFC